MCISVTIGTRILGDDEKKMCIISTLSPVHKPNFVKLARIVIRVIAESVCFHNNLTIYVTIATIIFMWQQKQMTCTISVLPPVHIQSFIKLA